MHSPCMIGSHSRFMIGLLHEPVVIIFQFRQQSRLQIKTHIMYHGGVALDGEWRYKICCSAVGNPLPNTNTFSIPSMMLRVCVLWNLKAVIMPSFCWTLFLGSNVHVRRPLATHSTSLLFTGDEKKYLPLCTFIVQLILPKGGAPACLEDEKLYPLLLHQKHVHEKRVHLKRTFKNIVLHLILMRHLSMLPQALWFILRLTNRCIDSDMTQV